MAGRPELHFPFTTVSSEYQHFDILKSWHMWKPGSFYLTVLSSLIACFLNYFFLSHIEAESYPAEVTSCVVDKVHTTAILRYFLQSFIQLQTIAQDSSNFLRRVPSTVCSLHGQSSLTAVLGLQQAHSRLADATSIGES